MGDNEGSEDSVHVIKAINGKICVPIPLANTLKCGYCNRGRGGKWSAANRLKKAKEHIVLKHADDAAASWSFQCNRCSAALDTWDAEDIHSTLQCSIDSSAPTLPILTALNDSYIVDGCIILLYPGQPSRCPMSNCQEGFFTSAKDTAAMNSIFRHLEIAHSIKLKKMWRCSICSCEMDGMHMRHHYKRCLKALNDRSGPPESTSQRGTLVVAHDMQDEGDSQSQLAYPAPDCSTTSDGPIRAPATTNLPPVNYSVMTLSTEVTGQSTPEPDRTLVATRGTSENEGSSLDDSRPRASVAFFNLWAIAFKGCKTKADLNGVLERCVEDWLAKSSRTLDSSLEGPRPRPQLATTAASARSKRNQSRQLQRQKKKEKAGSQEASRVQRLFNIYPKRAVRKVLGERPLQYTGSTEQATLYLSETYVRNPLSPIELHKARTLYDSCCWEAPSDSQMSYLDHPPSCLEIGRRLSRASNTAPGEDKLEYRHLRLLDPQGRLLETIFDKVWSLGIPDSWKSSRTVPIYKKGDSGDLSNFRPISLLPTMYKLFSGVLSQRITKASVDLEWMSPEQKGFLPGVNGIQEHTQLLRTVVEDAKANRTDMAMAFLDLRNAFGSIPHGILEELFSSLPIPSQLRKIIKDIYTTNQINFVAGNNTIPIHPTAGVRQGDALSTVVFNLAAEPLIRAAKKAIGYAIFRSSAKVTAFADDIALIASSTEDLQDAVDSVVMTAESLGLNFNPGKCVSLTLSKGKVTETQISISGCNIACLGAEVTHDYLGVPIGAKLQFRTDSQLVNHLDKLKDSLLAPWQKLEVFRSHLLPSLSHHLASGYCMKERLQELDKECRKFLRAITSAPEQTTNEFFYADRRVGGLGTFKISDEADIWTLARATQLLSSQDPTINTIFREQLLQTIKKGFRREDQPSSPPVAAYLSGSTENGMYRMRYGPNPATTLWSLARDAARRLKARVDISSDWNIYIVADDVRVQPCKAVKGLHTAVRKHHTGRFIAIPHQGTVAAAFTKETSPPKDIARLTSCRTTLSHMDWPLLFQARLDMLPLRGYPWALFESKHCRHCHSGEETTSHVLNSCRHNLTKYYNRHNAIQEKLDSLLRKAGINATINRRLPEKDLTGRIRRPDLEFELANSRIMIDVTVAHDRIDNTEAAYQRKIDRYVSFGIIKPLVVGSLGFWHPKNDEIRSITGIAHKSWAKLRRAARNIAIEHSMDIIRCHLSIPCSL